LRQRPRRRRPAGRRARRRRRARGHRAAAAHPAACALAPVRGAPRRRRRPPGARVIETVLVGLAAGLIAGLLGVGGGILMVPALVVFLGLSQLDAEATSLLAIVPTALVGAWRQDRYGNVRRRDGLIVGGLSIAGGAAGVAAANA